MTKPSRTWHFRQDLERAPKSTPSESVLCSAAAILNTQRGTFTKDRSRKNLCIVPQSPRLYMPSRVAKSLSCPTSPGRRLHFAPVVSMYVAVFLVRSGADNRQHSRRARIFWRPVASEFRCQTWSYALNKLKHFFSSARRK